ncbi:hypothetical protein ACVWYY_001624 [Thermostichus sp. MS-CIW-34]
MITKSWHYGFFRFMQLFQVAAGFRQHGAKGMPNRFGNSLTDSKLNTGIPAWAAPTLGQCLPPLLLDPKFLLSASVYGR